MPQVDSNEIPVNKMARARKNKEKEAVKITERSKPVIETKIESDEFSVVITIIVRH
jgi:hypothetical protein